MKMPFLVSSNSLAPPSRRLRQLSRAAERLARALQDLEPEGWEADDLRTLRRAEREIERLAWDLEDLAGSALHGERAERRAERVREAVEQGGGDAWDADEMAESARHDDRTCAVDGCQRRAVAACLCDAHRQRAAKGALRLEEPIAPRRPGALCSRPNCRRPHKAHGLCSAHYMAGRRAARAAAAPDGCASDGQRSPARPPL